MSQVEATLILMKSRIEMIFVDVFQKQVIQGLRASDERFFLEEGKEQTDS